MPQSLVVAITSRPRRRDRHRRNLVGHYVYRNRDGTGPDALRAYVTPACGHPCRACRGRGLRNPSRDRTPAAARRRTRIGAAERLPFVRITYVLISVLSNHADLAGAKHHPHRRGIESAIAAAGSVRQARHRSKVSLTFTPLRERRNRGFREVPEPLESPK